MPNAERSTVIALVPGSGIRRNLGLPPLAPAFVVATLRGWTGCLGPPREPRLVILISSFGAKRRRSRRDATLVDKLGERAKGVFLNANDSHPENAPETPASLPPAGHSDAPHFSPEPVADPAAPPSGEHESGHAPSSPADSAVSGGDSADPAVRLAALAERAVSTRLRPSEEDEAVQLLKALLTAGGHSLTSALAALPSLNWNVGATAVTAAWAGMSATAREALVTGLKREEQRTEAARRIRLSLARGLFKQDVEVAAKIIGAVCAEMKKASGEEPLSKSERRNFDAVMVGKGRPWICQLPLAEWRPAESAAVIHVAVASCFAGGNVPPFTQLSLLKWIADADRLEKLPEDSLEIIVEGVRRWSPKWKASLKKEVAVLPETLASVIASAEAAGEESTEATSSGEARRESSSGTDDSYGTAAEEDAREATEARDAGEADDEDDDESNDDEAESDDEAASADPADPSGATAAPGRRMTRRERGRLRRLGKSVSQAASGDANGAAVEASPDDTVHREPREKSGSRFERGFDVREALRMIERQYSQLKTELDVARSNLRQRDDGFTKPGRGRRGRAAEPAEAPMPESEVTALRQHNVRLEETVSELRLRVDELTGAAEDEATSRDAFSDGPTPGERAQFQTLLGLKLAQAKSDFEAMQGRERDDVFDENYKTLLARVFNLLTEHGITFPTVVRPDEHMQSM